MNSTDIFAELAQRIVSGQEAVIGPLALEQAKKVKGLKFTEGSVAIEGDKTKALENLVEQYHHIFGQASVEVCKDAVKPLVSKLSPQEVPSALR